MGERNTTNMEEKKMTVVGNPSGTQQIAETLAPVWRAILDHPFIASLQDGSLPRDAFIRFLQQDRIYLDQYAKALAFCAARSASTDDLIFFCEEAVTVIHVERTSHVELLSGLGLSEADIVPVEPSPTCLAYTSFDKQVCAFGERHEAISTLLECFWTYWEVGKYLAETKSPNPVYQKWADVYTSRRFEDACRTVLDIVDRIARDLSPDARASMVQHALTSARYDWMFWDSAYRDERWPI